MPWRGVDDLYFVWVSEVMLQQTRVDQALPYFQRFIHRFPTIESLARADLGDVLLLWEGLGYYSRARHLHRAAGIVVNERGGRIPAEYTEFRSLPGVGPYTAAAVLSIARGLPYAAVDGNVVRVLTRVFAVGDVSGMAGTKRRIQALADELMDRRRPGAFNEALMELGAVICTPRRPKCPECPLRELCEAYREGRPEAYPVSAEKKPVPHYDVVVAVIKNPEGRLYIQKRPEKGLLGGLWEFPGGKRENGETLSEACERELREELGFDVTLGEPFHRLSHAYSHFRITLHAFRGVAESGCGGPKSGIPSAWVAVDELNRYAFPRANRRLIEYLVGARNSLGLFETSD